MQIDIIRCEAHNAVLMGQTLEDSCRWPFDSREGQYFKEEFIMHKAALTALGIRIGPADKTLTPD